MIGLVFRALGMGGGGGLMDGSCLLILGGSALAVLTLCGICKCAGCRMRDCGCIKRFLRSTGTDKFDDFEMLVVIQESTFTSSKAKMHTCVRIKAGSQVVMTNEVSKGVGGETLSIFVEQGTDAIIVDLMDAREKKVLGTLKLDPVKDLIENKAAIGKEHLYVLKQKSKNILNPKIKMSFHLDWGEDEEKGLLSDTVSKETDLLIRSQLQKQVAQSPNSGEGGENDEPGHAMSKLEMMVKGCAGPVDMFGSWGMSSTVWIAIDGPPSRKKHTLCIYKDEKSKLKGAAPTTEIDLLKILSVQPDPGRPEYFILNYVDASKVKKRMTFRRVDRARDVWVEMFTILITILREEKESKSKMK